MSSGQGNKGVTNQSPHGGVGAGALIAIGILLAISMVFIWKNWKTSIVMLAHPNCKGTRGVQPGQCAPNFVLPILKDGQEGDRVSLSTYMGKPTVLYFFHTPCGVCLNHLPVVKELQARYQDRINFLYMDGFHMEGGMGELQDFLNRPHPATGQPLSLSPVFLGDENVFSDYRVLGTPMVYFIGKSGHVIHVSRGADLDMETRLKKMLADLPSGG
ncbi:TlpA family protein disulfide reductase [Pasteuria penetrans]|uniref:TlpA family protein disulfide reductase n=1 Tax=Pasteuria penetrans TaxID=86005 RepID=UPI000F9DFF00|nr:TlpA disulfide reductase family protein [Pasteuria penetrans]